MFMASKHEEITPMFLTSVQDNIGHGTFSNEAIKQAELEIAQTLSFRFTLVTPQTYLDWIEVVFSVLDTTSIVRTILRNAAQACKLSLIYYDMTLYTPGELAIGGVVYSINEMLDNDSEIRIPQLQRLQKEVRT